MGTIAFENAVYDRLQGKHHLQPLFSSGAYDIPHRLREYDPALFVVFNTRRQRFEIHSLNHVINTYACDVPNNRLDGRVEEVVRRGDIRVRGGKVFVEMDEHNRRIAKSRERQRKNDLMGIAEEMYPYFRQAGWEGV
jgi:hypothetical protein